MERIDKLSNEFLNKNEDFREVLAFAPPPTLFATARGPIAKIGGGFSCTVQLKAQTNDEDEDGDDEEEDGLDSLIGKKLGINIGAQL